ncbi:MAG TPA: chromosome segregation protein SMC, partial [Anaerolineae bacterium]|nr:chromosome segregation protein SMC [Anaerolineae bacterium]
MLKGRRSGIVGPVAECFRVPANLEGVMEAALGSRLQDLVVERWSDAEAAIAWLASEGAGRATFLPLDSLRPLPALRVPEGSGIVGIASELIQAEQGVRPALEVLLGRTLVVEDLPSASRVLKAQAADHIPSQIVTLAGEIVRSDGRISGGRGGSTSILARERERRDLPGLVSEATR